MAMKICSECGNELSSKASACPHCGASKKKKVGCLGALGFVFLVLIIISVIGSMVGDESGTPSQSISKSPPEPEKIFKEGETVSIGYTSYRVGRSWWSTRLSDNQFMNEPPNAMYLFIEITVRNDDKKARTIPPFQLIDENGAEYDTDNMAWAIDGSLGLIEDLNPSVQKTGFIVFDVPNNRKYKLKVSGGYWSGEEALIQINPS